MLTAFLKRFPIKFLLKMENGTAKSVEAATKDGRALRLVWIDCEMTGLPVTGLPGDSHRLVEIACIVTEADLTPVAQFGPVAISQSRDVIEGMSDWCKETFAKNGLIERIKTSDKSERETEKMVVDFLREHTPPGECLLAGNSVHQDQIFLRKYMPELCAHLHPYRIIDVTTVKELVKRWYPDSEGWNNAPPKKELHLALDDIEESVEQLKHYREHFFVKGGSH